MKRKFWLAVLLALIAMATLTAVAGAHANLLRSEPGDGAILDEAPGEVRLWFDESVSAQFSTAQLFDADSQPIPITTIRVDPADPTLMILTLPALLDGPYSVLYKALSNSDGHFSQGLVVFGVGAEVDLGAAAVSTAAESELPLPEVALRWLNFVLLAGTVGAIAMARLVLAPGAHNTPSEQAGRRVLEVAHSRIVRLAGICASLSIIVGFGLLAWQSSSLMVSLPENSSLPAVIRQILTTTQWGITWLGRQAIFLLLALFLLALIRQSRETPNRKKGRLRRIARPAVPLLALAVIAAQSLSSHASGLAEHTALALLADAVHLLAASLWVGGLLTLAIALLPLLRRQRSDAAQLIRAGWKPFSLVAALSVGLLITTGFYSAGRQVASPDALLTTLYGRVLLGKFGLVLAVGCVGLLNSVALHPQLARPLAWVLKRPDGWTPLSLRRLPMLVLVEGSLGLLVLVMTGVITASAAPRSSAYTIVPDEVPSALSQTVDDMVITFGAKPNRPGQNVFTVFAASTRRPPRTEIARVILRFNYQEEDVGRTSITAEEIEPGRYMIAGDYLNLAGPWQVDVVIRRLGREDTVARFNWIVAHPGETTPVVLSRLPLQPLLTGAAAFLLTIVLAAAGVWLSWRRPRYLSFFSFVKPRTTLFLFIKRLELIASLKAPESGKYEPPFSRTMNSYSRRD